MKIYCDVMRQLDSSGAHYSQDLSEVDLSAPDDVKVLVSDPQGEVLVHLGSSEYLDRYKVYVTHVQQWRQQFVKLESVDLRYDRQIIVNPDLGGAVMPAPLSLSAVKNAMAAGVKSAALARYERLPAKPLAGPSPARASMKPPIAAKSSKDLRRRSIGKSDRQRCTRDEARQEARVSEIAGDRTKTKSGRAPAKFASGGQEETKPGNCQGPGTTIGMGNQSGNLLTAIDVGSAKTCVLVAEIAESGLALSWSRCDRVPGVAQRRDRGAG